MLGSSFIANFRLTMNGPRGVITCSRGLNGSNHWILQISSLRLGREQHVPEFSNHHLFLKIREISEGTSYQMVRLVFRHFAADERFARRYRNETSPEILLTLPFSGIFRGFSACYSYSNHSQDHGQWQVCMCVCVCVVVYCVCCVLCCAIFVVKI